MQRITLFLLIICAAFTAMAETADGVMDKMVKKIRNTPCAVVKFTATSGDGDWTYGTLSVSKEKFAISTTEQSVWFDGKDMWAYSKKAGETNLSQPTTDELMEINPFYIVAQYKKHYTARLLSSNPRSYHIELTARSSSASVKKVVITVVKATTLPVMMEITFSNSATMKVSFDSIDLEKRSLPADTFRYPAKKYPGVEVIDLR